MVITYSGKNVTGRKKVSTFRKVVVREGGRRRRGSVGSIVR